MESLGSQGAADKGKEDNISPRALILAVIMGKLKTFTLHKPPEVL